MKTLGIALAVMFLMPMLAACAIDHPLPGERRSGPEVSSAENFATLLSRQQTFFN